MNINAYINNVFIMKDLEKYTLYENIEHMKIFKDKNYKKLNIRES